jgi:HPt (histidine-containing phosphotransfer) domain-containing protein
MITSELLEEDPSLIDLIDKFIARLPSMQTAILNAYNKKDYEHFSGLIHQLKGVGGGYGYPMLSALCAEIEVSAKEDNFDKIKNQLNEFKLLSDKILAGSDANHKLAKANK